MRTITLLLMLAVTCPVPYALSQDDRRGIPARLALERIASSHGAAIIEKIVEMKGRRGQSQPREWWIVVRDERSSSRLRTMWVGDARGSQAIDQATQHRFRQVAIDEGENKDFYPNLIPLGFISDKKLKVDSPAAFNILIREATAARVGFDSVDYKLRSKEFSDEPVWSLTAKDVRGKVVGKVLLSGLDGRIYRTVWYYRQAGGRVKIIDSALDAPGRPEAGDPIQDSLGEAANAYASAMRNGNYEKMASYFFPSKVIAMGGMANATKQMRESMKPLTINSIRITKIQTHHDGKVHLGVVHYVMEADRLNSINKKTYQLRQETGLIAHSNDSGQTWKFVGVTEQERNIFLSMMPNLLQVLDIPKEKTFVKEDGAWEPFPIP